MGLCFVGSRNNKGANVAGDGRLREKQSEMVWEVRSTEVGFHTEWVRKSLEDTNIKQKTDLI